MAAKLIWVRSTIPTKPDGGNTVALYESHEDHPDGEAYVAGPTPVQVARTGQVHRLISDGALEEVDAPPSETQETAATVAGSPTTGIAANAAGQQQADPLAFLSADQRGALAAAGYATPEAIRTATDEQLDAVPGIGPSTVASLREATKE